MMDTPGGELPVAVPYVGETRPLRWYRAWYIAWLCPRESWYRILAESPGATAKRGLIWVGLTCVVTSIFIASGNGTSLGDYILPFFFIGLVALESGILHGVAKLFGGKAKYTTIVFLLSAIFCPLLLLNDLPSLALPNAFQSLSDETPFLPYLARHPFEMILLLFSLATGLYSLFLQTLVVKAGEGLSWGRTAGAALITFVIGFAAWAGLFFLLVVLTMTG